MTKRMITWEIESWHEGDTERKFKRGMAFAEHDWKAARKALSAAIKRTDKVEGLFAKGRIVDLDESEAN